MQEHPLMALGLAHLTALDLPPAELIKAAGRAGFRSVGLRVHPAMPGGIVYPTQVGSRAHRELADILKSEGVRLNEIECFQLTPDVDIRSFEPLLAAGADLGAAAVTISGDDPDNSRLTANVARLCDLAQPFGLRVDIEFMRWRHIGTLQQADAIMRAAGRPNGAILVDALHLNRSGGTPADLDAIPVNFLRAVQLCDAAAAIPATEAAIIAEAREGRLPPGDGTLPLFDLMDALPDDIHASVEMPSPAYESRSRIAIAFQRTKELLESWRQNQKPKTTRAGRAR
jgi:sugar phosphate isomerase/epimerase